MQHKQKEHTFTQLKYILKHKENTSLASQNNIPKHHCIYSHRHKPYNNLHLFPEVEI